ncbi:FecR family protein [Microbulbifer yueqingensis]|uniref:FecR family protein n=1 Tax=Microbulbifer yueqingensis TaxID=658219 RepID=A0A1G8VQ23_9GAMM|nr:FecR family protein [Microbulbifer yueqingensis]SDJ67967.1 FecR family protein [Microbulbifer yueqingensis]
MNATGGHTSPGDDQLDQACAWIARLRSDAISATEKREFASWLNASPLNRRAFDEMTELWGDLGALGHMPVDELFPESRPSTPPSPSRAPRKTGDFSGSGFTQWLLGGGLVAACLVVTLWVGNQWLAGDARSQQVYATAVGETRTVTLADGTKVQLNTNSELRVSYSRDERQTALLRGEAYFDVVRQTARPFTVTAGKASIRVLGTEFNVERNRDNTRVSVTGGVVAVSESSSASGLQPESVKLAKNQKVSVSGRGISPVSSTSADEALDWTRGVLVFDRTPLNEALEELNRYLKVPAAAESSVRERKVSGTFELSDPDNTLTAIAAAMDLREDRSDPNLTLLSPASN